MNKAFKTFLSQVVKTTWSIPPVVLAASACITVSASAQEAEEFVEEILVTGSYLKRTAADSPSPLSVVTSEDIRSQGAVDVGEILQAMPWQSGSQVRTTTFGGEGANGQISINLRNLGNASTLPLLNGKRLVASRYDGATGTASVDINALIPNIAIDRIEILKDGSSALYGSDAVAGVVNFLTRKDFQGFEAQIEASTDEETRLGDMWNFSAIMGLQGDRGRMVLSMGILRRDEINVDDRYEDYGATTASPTGQPGRFGPTQNVLWADGTPARDPAFPNNPRRMPHNPAGSVWGNADVDCENSAELEQGGTLGLYFNNDICAYDFGSFFPIQAKESYDKFHVTGSYDLTDSIEIYAEAGSSRSKFERLNSWNPNSDAAVIPLASPGLIEDAARRGITPQPLVNRTRTLGGTRNTPYEQRPTKTFSNYPRNQTRMILGALWDFSVADRLWTMDVSMTASKFDSAITERQDTRAAQFDLALSGFGGPNCDPVNGIAGSGNAAYAASGNFDDGTCYFFNPFGSHQFDADGNFQDPSANNATVANGRMLQNPAELYKWLEGSAEWDQEFENTVFDLVFAGDLAQTRWGPVGLAVGYQQRKDTAQVITGGDLSANNLAFVFGEQSWSGTLTTRAVFAEFGIPIGDRIDLNLAVRHEDFSELDQNSTDPKISVLWRPLDSLSLRASWGTSFRIGSLQQLFGTSGSVRVVFDPLIGPGGVPIIGPAEQDRIFDLEADTGADLRPEEAEVFNVGVSWSPVGGFLEGFQIDLDYYDYEYSDLITRESANRLLTEDAAAFVAQSEITGDSIENLVAESVACFRQTGDGSQCVGNPRQVVRNSLAEVSQVNPEFINANNLDVAGLDINTSYSWEMSSVGFWRAGLQAAWIHKYDIGIPTSGGEINVFEGAGSRNAGNEVGRPLPEWKINGTLNWSLQNHNVFLIVKYVDGYRHDTPQSPFNIALADRELGIDLNTPTVKSHTTADIQYSYTLPKIGFQSSGVVTLGIRNVTDESPPLSNQSHTFEPTLHDPLGRVWYLRYWMSL